MKKVIILLVALVGINGATAQGCLPEGITFTSQAQIDSFQINYPGCTQIEGVVHINGSDISNLNGLSVLTSIGNTLEIAGNAILTNLTGMENLTSIGGCVYIYSNNNLTSLTGLENLASIWEFLEIGANDALISLTGVENLSFVGDCLEIYFNPKLTSLMGLENLTSIGGCLQIFENPSLTSLTGLDNIESGSIIGLSITNNSLLSTCEVQSVCDYLTSPGGGTEIYSNAPGCNSQAEVEEACGIIGIEESSHTNDFSIYPNPSRSQITIETSAIPGRISILDLSGRLIMNRQVSEPETVIDVSSLPRGLYFVRMQDNTGVRVKKMVKD